MFTMAKIMEMEQTERNKVNILDTQLICIVENLKSKTIEKINYS